jgi:uncharacterized protein (TIGR02246 family)
VLAAIGLLAAQESSSAKRSEPARGKAAAKAGQDGQARAQKKAAKDDVKASDDAKASKDDSEKADERSPDEEAILKTAETFARAYAEGDAKAAAAHFTENAEYIDEEGNRFQGRDEIERNFERFFSDNKGVSFDIDVDSIRFVDPSMAVEDGTSTIISGDGMPRGRSRYVAVHMKTGGKWLVAMVREHARKGERRHREELQQLDWLTGQWVDEADESIVVFNCARVDDGNYLLREFKVTVAGDEVISGSQRIGWDPLTGRLRAWTFDSQGGHFEGVWRRDGDSWVLTSTGVTAGGETASGTSLFTIIDPHTITWQAVDREIEGARRPDSDLYTLVRVGPAPEVRAPEARDEEAKK